MPLWTLHHSPATLDEPDRALLAAAITDIYAILPRFYVAVVFHETAPGSLYIGGEPAPRFVRITVDHIARRLPNAQAQAGFLDRVHAVLVGFMAERDLNWELHIDETPMELWSINGLRPPPPNSAAETRWMRENRATPYDPADT